MDLVTADKELVGTHWQHKITGQRVVVKEQFRVGMDIDSWVDCRDEQNACQMLISAQLVRDYQRIG